MIYHGTTGEASFDLWALPLEGDRQPIPIARTQFNEVYGTVSPDSRWIAYASDESVRHEIYVQRFPDASIDQKTPVSTGGGMQPRWSKDGRELFYLRADGMLVSVAIKTQPTFEPRTKRVYAYHERLGRSRRESIGPRVDRDGDSGEE